jgi:hypothetical protein
MLTFVVFMLLGDFLLRSGWAIWRQYQWKKMSSIPAGAAVSSSIPPPPVFSESREFSRGHILNDGEPLCAGNGSHAVLLGGAPLCVRCFALQFDEERERWSTET